jgi:hypothetical protein
VRTREGGDVNQDQEHLRLLSIFHYVLAGFACLLPLFSLIYIGMGVVVLTGKMSGGAHPAAPGDTLGGWFFIAFGAIFFFAGVIGATLNILAGRALAKHERRTLCLVVACLNCLHMPLGTLLGVFTLIVLARPTVKVLFEGSPRDAWPAPGPSYPAGGSPFSNPNP